MKKTTIKDNSQKFYSFLIKCCKTIAELFDKYFIRGELDGPFNPFPFFILVSASVILPIIDAEQYFANIGLMVILEIIFFLCWLALFLCTYFKHKRKAVFWVSLVVLLLKYVSYFDKGSSWNTIYQTTYLWFVVAYFTVIVAWNSAKQINTNGGRLDTLILAIGLALTVMGVILNDELQYRWALIVGLALVYLYIFSRTILRLFFGIKNNEKPHLINIIGCIVLYSGLIIAFPFLLRYTGLEEDIIKTIIVPIYASVIGGLMTLGGVAWTIQKGKTDRENDIKRLNDERKEEERKKYVPYLKFTKNKPDYIVVADVAHHIDFTKIAIADNNKGYFYSICIAPFAIKNISNQNILLDSILIDGHGYEFSGDILIEKDSSCLVQASWNNYYPYKEPIQNIGLAVRDVLGNRYILNCKFQLSIREQVEEIHNSSQKFVSVLSNCIIHNVELPKLI